MDGQHVDAVIQILPECTGFHQPFQVPVDGGDSPFGIDGNNAVTDIIQDRVKGILAIYVGHGLDKADGLQPVESGQGFKDILSRHLPRHRIYLQVNIGQLLLALHLYGKDVHGLIGNAPGYVCDNAEAI